MLAGVGAAVVCTSAGCPTYRIERHKRSPIYFNEKYVEGGVTHQMTLDDGTVVYFEPVDTSSTFGRKRDGKGEPFKIREELDDGTIVLRALLPEHVLVNLFNCLRAAEYELMYDQLLSDSTRQAWEQGRGYDGFEAYMRQHQLKIAQLARRMIVGLPHQEVKFTEMSADITRCRLRPQVGGQFSFKWIDVRREPTGQYKLHSIQ